MDSRRIGITDLVAGVLPYLDYHCCGCRGIPLGKIRESLQTLILFRVNHMIYLQLFYTFFKIGLFGFGGGYAMLSMIQGEVVTRYGWVSSQEFTDIVAISQMTPGPIGINTATYVGFTSTGSVWGSIIATFAVVLPSFILMLTISKFFLKYQKHPVVESVFSGLRPAVVGLLASAALVLMNTENFGSPSEDTYSFVISVIIFLVVFIGTRKYKANPILMIIACGIAGLLLY